MARVASAWKSPTRVSIHGTLLICILEYKYRPPTSNRVKTNKNNSIEPYNIEENFALDRNLFVMRLRNGRVIHARDVGFPKTSRVGESSRATKDTAPASAVPEGQDSNTAPQKVVFKRQAFEPAPQMDLTKGTARLECGTACLSAFMAS